EARIRPLRREHEERSGTALTGSLLDVELVREFSAAKEERHRGGELTGVDATLREQHRLGVVEIDLVAREDDRLGRRLIVLPTKQPRLLEDHRAGGSLLPLERLVRILLPKLGLEVLGLLVEGLHPIDERFDVRLHRLALHRRGSSTWRRYLSPSGA